MSDWKLDRQNAYVPDVIPDSDLAMYRKANFGHPIGWGRKVSIVVVDMTRAFVEDGFALGSAKMGQAALRGIARLLEVARPIGISVCFTKMVPFRNRTEAGRWYDSCPGIFGRPDDPAAHESAAIPPEIAPRPDEPRSEEHTSELQSHSDLVCRLLLEKKNRTTTSTRATSC